MSPTLENVDWHRFLGRPPFPSPTPETLAFVARHPILITGAGGSIGSSLALRLKSAGARLILLDSSESRLFDLHADFDDAAPAHPEFHLGSAGDSHLLEEIFERRHPHLVFHCAAFKHVPLLEEQPFAAINNNIFATQTLISRASEYDARIIFLSTDKVVEPASVMGATKRVAEQIVLTSRGTVLRLGNVLGSRGSVAEVFAGQIAAGASLTVTDPAARRYILTIDEAVDLLLAAAGQTTASALFIPDLRTTHYIADLARFMARTLAPSREISIEFTRLRAGDKESEALFSPREAPRATLTSGLIPVDSAALPVDDLHESLQELNAGCESRDLTATVSILRRMVPDYTLSPVIEAMLSTAERPVNNA